ncbi:hypothetical protein C8A00DRAFT_14330, partial [Chaetomidium leptoderma]
GGYSWTTWCWRHDPSMFWPVWLQHKQGLSHFRVFTFGYNANWRGPDTTLSILDFGKGLLVRMRGYGDCESNGERQWSTAADHLCCPFHGRASREERYVRAFPPTMAADPDQAYVLGKYDEHYTDVISHVHGIVFLSTPHNPRSGLREVRGKSSNYFYRLIVT